MAKVQCSVCGKKISKIWALPIADGNYICSDCSVAAGYKATADRTMLTPERVAADIEEEAQRKMSTKALKKKDIKRDYLNMQKRVESLEEENIALSDKIERLSAAIDPEVQELIDVQVEVDKLEKNIAEAKETIKSQREKLKTIQDAIIVANDTVELESFSLYEPKWDFAKVHEYKTALTVIRNKQKELIKSDTAAFGSTTWTVNGSQAKGTKLVKDMKKLCLRSFNNECDAAVAAVRFNNYDRCETRIYKSAEAVAKLGQMMDVSISSEYINAKIEELQLALEYEIKKQEEKEYLRELRAQEREEARARKEMEEARKTAEKEQTHYENALSKVLTQLNSATNEDEKITLEEKRRELEDRLKEIDDNIKDLDYREANQKAGYVYVISNIGAFGENIYKIGMTRRLDPQERIDELGDASVPFKFDAHAIIFSDDAPALEAALHREFDDRKVNMINNRKEFFNVTLDEIKEVVLNHHDKAVEFTDVPSADQYRESLKMKEIQQ